MMTAPVLAAPVWRVVVVDDSPDDRAEVRRLLLTGSDRRYRWTEAETGAEALRAVADSGGPPDCIVLDYNLPDMNAVEVLEALVGPDGLTVCPVVVLTGSVGHEHTRAVLRAGAQDYLGKGWMTAESLVRAVENAAERWAMAHELRASEAALRASEEFRRQSFDQLATFAGVLDLDGTLIEANRALIEAGGLSRADAIGKPFWECAWWAHAPEVQARLRDAIAEARRGRTVQYDVDVMTAGGPMPIEFQLAPLRDATGRVTHLIPSAVDLTARRRAERALRESEQRLKEAQRIARLGSWTWEPPTGRVWWSDAIYELFGLDPATAEPSYEAFLARVHPADRPVAVRRVEAVLAGADGFADDLRLVTPDGRVIWIHSQARATRTADGRLVLVEGTDQDITARKFAEAALKESDERFRLAAAATHAMVYDLDVPARRINSLHGVNHLVGYSESEIEPTLAWWDGRIDPADLPSCHAAFQRLRAAPCEQTLQYRVRHKDGRTLWVEDRVTPICDGTGGLVRLVGTVVDITERKQSEELLRRNHETFYHLVQNNPFGVYVVDADFRLRQVSLGAQKVFRSIFPLLGRDFEEVIRALWPEPFAGDVVARFRHTLATGALYAAPRTIERRRDIGEVEAYDWRIERVTLPDGRYGVVCYFYDLSERQRWEAALVAKERELRALADNSPDVLTRFDRDLRHVFVNAAVERATGRPPAAFLGKTNRALGMPADLCDQWEAALRLVFDQGRPTALEFSFDAHDGPRHFTARLVPEFAPDGSVEFVLSVAHDATDRKRAEAAQRTSEERLARAQRAARVGTWDWDIVTGLATWTDEAWELFGPADRAGPVTYDFWLACLHPDDRAAAAAATAAALAGDAYHDEFRVCRSDGSVLWIESDGAVVRDDDGRAVRLLGTVRNVTDRKRAEEALKTADRRKDEFLAVLAHELRNPLAPIRNGIEVLRLADLPPKVVKTLAMMDRQLGHMINLIDDLLDVSRVRSGKITLRAERVTVREAVEAAVEACRPCIDEKRHALVLELPTVPLVLTADRTRVVQVVANLLTNAAKYSEPGGHIRVTAEWEGDEAVVRVSDTGVGIAPELLPTLWDMFTQVRDTLDKAQGGLGIGLSLVKNLVEMHGGTVSAESAGIGTGSTFVVRLPLATAAADRADEPAGRTNGRAPVAAGGRRILVVDDNVDGAESLAELLQISGHVTRTAHSGPAALTAAAEHRPDLVFLDIGLPGLDGYEVARRLRADPLTAGTVLVALTGWGTEDDRRKTKEAGFDFHLTKPVEGDRVMALLGRLSTGKHGSPPGAADVL
ncbi:PAS domain S-box protein [Frigoriglobus tundricola]|uniref:histidine kinase n=1 Tax=Frigoriglobus tundricola TaxID=2774151 RepID=A0A6M5YG44_9BACT|nr:PAS domain S-box protein [Frigoriglobus tundricola]QJW92958.1 Autoinducer 2 sensor kinase/phosphatase LuxQ [Frigoriglobus tundricola]